ncbi:MAG: LEA type 2 family protein [Halobacteriales archaeon]|nr:LEA type 2 family protein [Halobacteriales archaeon]
MSRALGRLSAILGLVVLLVAAIGGAYAAGLLGVPSVSGVDNRFAGVNDTTTLIETNLTVSNPNPIGVQLGGLGIDYTVRLNDVALAAGSKQGVSVGSGNSTLTFRTAMANERIPAWWVSHIRNDERTTLRVEANVTSGLLGRSIEVTPVERPIETDILSGFNSTETRPVNADSALVSDPVLYINETRASWGEVTSATTPMDMAFVVYNPKPVPYAITEVRYAITMNGIDVGEGATTREYVIEPGTTETIRAGTAIRNGALDEWWVSHLRNDQVTELRIEFSATVELPTGGTVDVPLDELTYTETIETDFFGNEAGGAGDGNAATETPNDASTATDTADGSATTGGTETATAESGGGTASPTASPTSAPTPTPTPTPDDGGIIGNATVTDTDVL